MTEQEWLEARARGLELRRRIEEGMTRALIESGVMKDCFAYIQAAEQKMHPTELDSAEKSDSLVIGG